MAMYNANPELFSRGAAPKKIIAQKGDIIIPFDSIAKAAKAIGDYTNIRRAASRNGKYKGYTFKYA